MNRIPALAGLVLAVALAAGCSQKEPAQTAIDAAETALMAVHEEAQKYIPKQYAELKAELDNARGYFTEEQYVRAIDEVKDIPAKARALGAAAAAAREALAAEIVVEWARLRDELPGKLAGLEGRLDEFDKARRLPDGLDREALLRINAGAGVARAAWNQAAGAFEAGNLEGAVARALESDNLAGELMAELGMTPAPAAD